MKYFAKSKVHNYTLAKLCYSCHYFHYNHNLPCSMAALSVASGCDDPVGFLTKRLLLLESSSQLSSFQNSTTLKSEHILLFNLIYVY